MLDRETSDRPGEMGSALGRYGRTGSEPQWGDLLAIRQPAAGK